MDNMIAVPAMLSGEIGTLPSHSFHVSPATPTQVVVQALKRQPELPGVLILDGGICLSMVSRQKCFEQLSRPFGVDVFLKRPVRALYEAAAFEPTRLSATTPVAQAVQITLSRSAEQRYEPIIVEFDGQPCALLDVHVLLLAQSHLLTRANNLIQQQVDIGRALSSTLAVKEVLELILEHMGALVAYDCASILLQQGDTLEFAAARNSSTRLQPAGEGVSERHYDLFHQVSLTRQPVLISGDSGRPQAVVSPPHSCLGLPLIHSNEVIGMLSLERDLAEPYNPEVLPLAQTFAAQAAIALQNARLFEEVQRLATTDPLTRLVNRRHFFSLAKREHERALRYGRPLSVIMLDVDHFKRINDAHGHAVGDLVLQAIASRCLAAMREVDVVSRYGGEEFLVLLPETSLADAVQIAERLRWLISATPITAEALQLSITVSLGAAGWEAGCEPVTLQQLVNQADQAMYRAKRTGRNRALGWDRPCAGGEAGRPAVPGLESIEEGWQVAALEQLPDGLLLTDLHGNILWANPAYAAQTGYTLSEIRGRNPRQFSSGYQSRSFYQNLWNTLSSGQVWHDQLIDSRKDGTLYLLELTILPMRNAFGSIAYFLGYSHDVTEQERRKAQTQQQVEENRQRLAELEAVSRVSAAMRAAQTLEAMLPRLMDEMLAVFSSETGAIWLYDEVKNELVNAIARGWSADLQAKPPRPGEGMIGTVFSSNIPYQCREFTADRLLGSEGRSRVPDGWGGLCVPIRTADKNVGVLFVARPSSQAAAPAEVRLLTTLAEIAGNAIHRMRLHDRTEQQLRRLTALRAIDTAIAGSHGLDTVLALLLEELAAQLGVHAAAVLITDPATHGLKYMAGRGFKRSEIVRAQVRLGEGQAGLAALEQRLVQIDDLSQSVLPEPFAEFVTAEGFVAYFAVPLIAKGQVIGVLEVYHRTPLHPDAEWLAYLETLGGQAAIVIDSTRLFDNLQRSNADLAQAYDATLESWDRMLELRDLETEGHTQRVVAMAVRLGRAMGLSEPELLQLRRGALLHDVGKMGTPDSILLKPGPLTADEQTIMRRHPLYAYQMLADVGFLRPALDVPYCHHEKWDGTGYPRGLRGETIPLSARIFAVVDVYDALSSDRPYRPAWPPEQVLRYIVEQAGQHFDPAVVTVFMRAVAEVETVPPGEA